MDFLQKYFCGVFFTPFTGTEKRPKTYKKKQEKKSAGGWMGLGFSKNVRGGPSIVFGRLRGARVGAVGRGQSRRELGGRTWTCAVLLAKKTGGGGGRFAISRCFF
jgi:hypothetical protein